jgi:thioredoxin-like negative regulator of GroEL
MNNPVTIDQPGTIDRPGTTDRLREITDMASLSRVINDAAHPALVLFDTVWCSPARRIEERLLRLFRGGCVDLVRVNVDRVPELAKKFAVHAVPTLALFRAGQLAATRLGDVEDGDLQHWLDRECMPSPT